VFLSFLWFQSSLYKSCAFPAKDGGAVIGVKRIAYVRRRMAGRDTAAQRDRPSLNVIGTVNHRKPLTANNSEPYRLPGSNRRTSRHAT